MYFSTVGMSDRQRSSSRVRTNEDKMLKKDLFWSVRADKLPDVSDPGLEEAERYKMISEPTRDFTGACGSGVWAWCTGIWRVCARASGMRCWH